MCKTNNTLANVHFTICNFHLFWLLTALTFCLWLGGFNILFLISSNWNFIFSGIPQGKLIKRQRLPKNDIGDHWHWKDLNIGIDVTFYGKTFFIFDCNKWTKVLFWSIWWKSGCSKLFFCQDGSISWKFFISQVIWYSLQQNISIF